MFNIEESLKKFNNLAPEIILSVDNDEVLEKLKKLESKHNVDLSSLVVIVVANNLTEVDILNYLKREFGVTDIVANAIWKDLNEEIFLPLKKRLEFLDANNSKAMKETEEKNIVAEIVKNSLIKELKSHPIIKNAINQRIFYILSKDINFKKELERDLYSNQEMLTSVNLNLDGQVVKATVSNWLKDFIGDNGSGIFDSVILSKYLTQSENAKKLNVPEKKLVSDLLEFYRNLKFFPESMPSDNGDGWEIFSIEKNDNGMSKARTVSGPPKSEEERIIGELEKMSIQYSQGSLEKKVIEEEIKKIKNQI